MPASACAAVPGTSTTGSALLGAEFGVSPIFPRGKLVVVVIGEVSSSASIVPPSSGADAIVVGAVG